ncbi:MAG: hypothetical protein VW257_05035, partial [Quisquiliibacterium sp.]
MFFASFVPERVWAIRLARAIAVSLILGASHQIAEAAKQVQANKQTKQRKADQAFISARKAALTADAGRLAAAARGIGKHPLAEYLDYWRLRLRLLPVRNRDGDSVGSDGSADSAVLAFLARHEGKLVAELLRRDWMLDLGRRRQWPELIKQYDRWIQHDDIRVECFYHLAISRGADSLAPLAETLLFAPRELGEGCT